MHYLHLFITLFASLTQAQLFPDAFSNINPALADQLTATLAAYFSSVYQQPEASTINLELYTATGSVGAAYSAGDPDGELGVGLLTNLLGATATPTWFSVLPSDVQSWLLSVDSGLDTIFQEFETMTAGGTPGGPGPVSSMEGPISTPDMSTTMNSGESSSLSSMSVSSTSAPLSMTSSPSMMTTTPPSSFMSAQASTASTMAAATMSGSGRLKIDGLSLVMMLVSQVGMVLAVWMT